MTEKEKVKNGWIKEDILVYYKDGVALTAEHGRDITC